MKWKTKRYYKEQNELLKLDILNLDSKYVELNDLYAKAIEDIKILKMSLESARKGYKTANKTMDTYIKQNERLIADIFALKDRLSEKEEKRRAAAGKLGGYVKENHKLLKRIAELEEEKSKCWILKTLPAGKIPNTQRLRIKSSSKQSNIMKNLQKGANNEN